MKQTPLYLTKHVVLHGILVVLSFCSVRHRSPMKMRYKYLAASMRPFPCVVLYMDAFSKVRMPSFEHSH